MFEFEMMLTGYTLIVVTTTVVITKFFSRRHLKTINKELSELKTESEKMNLEINKLHGLLKR